MRSMTWLTVAIVSSGLLFACGGRVVEEPAQKEALVQRAPDGGDLGADPDATSSSGEAARPSTTAVSLSTEISAMASDDTGVYAVDQMGVAYRLPLEGGPAAVIAKPTATSYAYPHDLALDDTWLYWTDLVRGAVVRAPKAGGAIETIASGQARPMSVAREGDVLVWSNEGEQTELKGNSYDAGSIMRMSTSSGPPIAIATGVGRPRFVAVAKGWAYWTADSPSGYTSTAIWRAPIDGSAKPVPIADGLRQVMRLVVSGDDVLFTEYLSPNTTLTRVPMTGGASTPIVATPIVTGVVADARGIVYGTKDFAAGTSAIIARDFDGRQRVIARVKFPHDGNVFAAEALTTAGSRVFWSDMWWSYSAGGPHVTIDWTGR
jgi:hypothetical protein